MAYKRTFRKHRFIGLMLPSSPWIAALALLAGGMLFLLPNPFMASLLALTTPLPAYKLLRVFFAWYDDSVTIEAGEHYLVMRKGRVGMQEQRIPLSGSFPATYNRPRWATLFHLDLADVTIAAIGGPYVMPHMGNFADLWTAVTSLGEEVPEKHPIGLSLGLTQLSHGLLTLLYRAASGLASLSHDLQVLLQRASASLLASTRRIPKHRIQNAARPSESVHSRIPDVDIRQNVDHPTNRSLPIWPPADLAVAETGVPDGGYFYKGTSFSAHTPSHAGFMAFCECFVLAGNWSFWNYRRSDPKRPYYPDGIAESVAVMYLACLRQNMILIPVSNGHGAERLSARARSIQNIENIILNPAWTDNRTDSKPASKVA
jgi:hypothetical protein